MVLLRTLPRPVRRVLPPLLLLLVASMIGFCSHHTGQLGRRYASLAELEAQQHKSGYVRIGSFGEDWPARVIEIMTSQDQISFTRQNGNRHSYNGFTGYTLKLIRLEGRHGELVVVFRSAPDAPADRDIDLPRRGENPVRVL
ncbi:MAG TPA: hypothetical protein VJ995_10345 [Geothermobacteraceae bacterium]|nr:hypothetical protein [Geothermobacteraceae bacterium]